MPVVTLLIGKGELMHRSQCLALLAELKLRLIMSSRLLLDLSKNSEGSRVRISDRQSPGFLTLRVTAPLYEKVGSLTEQFATSR